MTLTENNDSVRSLQECFLFFCDRFKNISPPRWQLMHEPWLNVDVVVGRFIPLRSILSNKVHVSPTGSEKSRDFQPDR